MSEVDHFTAWRTINEAGRVPTGVCVVVRQQPSPDDKNDLDPLLLTHIRASKHGHGLISVAGGWLEPGEHPFECAARELHEEYCLSRAAESMVMLGITSQTHEDVGLTDLTLWVYTVVMTPFGHEPVSGEPDKVTGVAYRSLSNLETSEGLFLPFRRALDTHLLQGLSRGERRRTELRP